MNGAVVATGFACVGVLGFIYYATYMRLLHGRDAHALAIADLTEQLEHERACRVALCNWLGVDVYASDIDPSWADADTEELPAAEPDLPDTVEMHKAFDASAADLVAEHDRQAKRSEWVESELQRFDFSGRRR